MFDKSADQEYLEIAAQMLKIDIGVLNKRHPELVATLNQTNNYIHTVKPYGVFQSTQAIASIITQYFINREYKEDILNLISPDRDD
jgi:hypothetical protein